MEFTENNLKKNTPENSLGRFTESIIPGSFCDGKKIYEIVEKFLALFPKSKTEITRLTNESRYIRIPAENITLEKLLPLIKDNKNLQVSAFLAGLMNEPIEIRWGIRNIIDGENDYYLFIYIPDSEENRKKVKNFVSENKIE